MIANLIYRANGQQQSYYRDANNNKIPGDIIPSGTLLYLRNISCQLTETDNVFELAAKDIEDKYYILLDANQVQFVEGNANAFRE